MSVNILLKLCRVKAQTTMQSFFHLYDASIFIYFDRSLLKSFNYSIQWAYKILAEKLECTF